MPAIKTCRKGVDTYLYYAGDMGQKLGERRGIAACIYGDTPQEDRERAGYAPVYPDTYRGGLPDVASRIIYRGKKNF